VIFLDQSVQDIVVSNRGRQYVRD